MLGQDLRHTIRTLAKQPGFTAIIVVSLALGIGANTMIFSFVNGLLLRPLPLPNGEDIVLIWFTPPNQPGGLAPANRSNCMEVVLRNTAFEAATCVFSTAVNIGEDGAATLAPERIVGDTVVYGFGDVVATEPLLGRWFTREEGEWDAEPVVLISYDQWQSRFGGTPDVLGKQVRYDGQLATIIGVMPAGFEFLNPEAEWWAPFRNPPSSANSPARFLNVAARMESGASRAAIQTQLDVLAAALAEEFPGTNAGWGISFESIEEARARGTFEALMTFQGAVAFVLLIACANVAGLLLADGSARYRELALRSALGSSRWRIMRGLLAKSVLLGLMGSVAGLFVGWAGLRVFMSLLPQLGVQIGMDWRVLVFTLLLGCVAGLLFGILPALQISRPNVMDALRDNTRSATVGAGRQRLRSAFVVVQISLALVLLVGGGLLIKSFLTLNAVDMGLDRDDLLTFQIQYPQGEYFSDTGRTAPSGSSVVNLSPRINLTSERIRERLAAIPGVESATASSIPPMFGFRSYNFTIQGREAPPPDDPQQSSQWNAVMGDYFRTTDIPILRGRGIEPSDTGAGLPVVVIDTVLAERYWPNQDPLGQRIQIDYWNDPPREIVGVVGHVRLPIRQDTPEPQMYIPHAQIPTEQEGQTGFGLQSVGFTVRSNLPASELVPAMRAAAREVDPTQAVSEFRSVNEVIALQLTQEWIFATLLGTFAGVAVLLAIVGIYGVMTHAVSQRTSEIGIRVALGARPSEVLRVILRRGLWLILAGLGIGFVISIAVTRVVQAVLYGVTATDPVTFAAAVAGLALAALLACYVPARKALEIDPLEALRYE